MTPLNYRIVNVFVPDQPRGPAALHGNPLCVFEDGAALDTGTMMALTRQFNLSETTFLQPATTVGATARVRIFTPTSDPASAEMRFAGHPSLGSAHVLRALARAADQACLEVPAGQVLVRADGDHWTLTTPHAGEPRVRMETADPAAVAAQVGLNADDLAGPPVWIDTGTEQLMVPVRDPHRVNAASASSARPWVRDAGGRANVYLFAPNGRTEAGHDRILSRFFIQAAGIGVFEDPGTGSACANLGGWMRAVAGRDQVHAWIDQGIAIGRHCRLSLALSGDGTIRVGGRVVEIARGELRLPGQQGWS